MPQLDDSKLQGAIETEGWREIERRLRREIEQGNFCAGEQIPTEPRLIERFGASRYAIRRALTKLQKDGLVRIEQGRGTFVHDEYLLSYKLGDRARFTDVLLENHMTPGQEVIGVKIIPVTGVVADALGLDNNAMTIQMDCLGYANGHVVKKDTNYLPLPRFEGIETTLQSSQSITSALQAFGVADYKRKSTSIVGRLPTSSEARMLRQLPTKPIFEILRLDVDIEGEPILYGETLFSCERVRLTLGS